MRQGLAPCQKGDTAMPEKVLQIQMLGGFSMHYGNEAVVMNKAGSSKSVRLLQMLLLSVPKGISKIEIICTAGMKSRIRLTAIKI